MYGVGDITPGGFGKNWALGGAGIALPTESSLNNMNPASYYTIDSLAFLTDVGINVKRSTFIDGPLKQTSNNAGLGFLALGFRNTSWWKNSIGIVPFSGVGNNINTTEPIDGTTDYLKVNFQGTGGLNQVYWGNAFKILPNLAVGANLSFIFGSMTQTQDITSGLFSGDLTTVDNIYLHKLYLNYGAQYSFKLSGKLKGGIGLVYGGPCKLNLFHNMTTTDNSGTILQDQVTNETSFMLPAYYGAGFFLKLNDKLLVTSDFKYSNWAKSQPLQTQTNVIFVNSTSINVGIEFTPSTSFRDQGLKKLNYRVGGYLNPTYLMINGHQIEDKGLTAGLGIPLIQKKIYFNMAYQLGKKGIDSGQGIINEYYQRFNISITLFDFWFIKPKFD
jgi:hypothetical protein